MKKFLSMRFWLLISGIAILFSCTPQKTENTELPMSYTRGIGVYPGDPDEYLAPEMNKDYTYRNIALHRAVYQSSSYDFNLTSQLLTDGILCDEEPNILITRTPEGELPKREKEWAIDAGEYTRNILMGEDTFIEYEWTGQMISAQSITLKGSLAYDAEKAINGYEIIVWTSADGTNWFDAAKIESSGLPGEATSWKAHSDPNKTTEQATLPTRSLNLNIDLETSKPFKHFKLELKMPGAAHWTFTEIQFKDKQQQVLNTLPSQVFNSAWMSAEGDEQWVYVDLGTKATFDLVKLYWIHRPTKAQIETSDDAENWTQLAELPSDQGVTDSIACAGLARYVRILMQQPDESGKYVLSEMEVFGKEGLVANPTKRVAHTDRLLSLNGGDWRLERASQVKEVGEDISTTAFDASSWIAATVPGTVLTSYINIGAVPNPNFEDNLMMISESYFNDDFWYRTEFNLPNSYQGKNIFLNFDGINWKADVFLNGKKVDRIEGAFIRGLKDVTSDLKPGKNVLAVRVIHNAHYGAVKEKNEINTDFNGGILGADNPTFHASIGWDWISTVRGRNMGIWNNVFLSTADKVTVQDPLLLTKLALPDTLATLTPSVFVTNHDDQDVHAVLSGFVGDIQFEKEIDLKAGSQQEISFSPQELAQLRDQRLNLWWPNGYGTPYLYKAGFTVKVNGTVSDQLIYQAGIRQMDYEDVDTQLKLYVNGKRYIPLGGNWGFSEHNLNYRAREYDIAVRYHQDMHFNMIRNWVGQIGDEPFYEACDKYGVMVWQDFWLANPADGPDPDDESMFMFNAKDYVKRIRNHASIALYCGRNEGYPTATLDKAFREFVAELHPDMVYFSSSADDGVSGHGPYNALSAEEYFKRVPVKFHSERGMPNVMNYESMARTIRPDHLWPQSGKWGQHDYTMEGAQRGASFNQLIETGFGKPKNAKQFTELAQWINYNGYRAMYESANVNRLGLIIWMSHPCWPSMVWQTYDYYFEPTAAYFGAKKACEPIHIQWNAATDSIEIVNLYKGDLQGLVAELTIRDMQGAIVFTKLEKDLNIANDSTTPCMALGEDESPTTVSYVCLKLYDANQQLISENFYIRSKDVNDYQELKRLKPAELSCKMSYTEQQRQWHGKVTVTNKSNFPALMIRLNVLGGDDEQILPMMYSDNYFSLMPGETKEVTLQWADRDSRGKKAKVMVSAYNVEEFSAKISY